MCAKNTEVNAGASGLSSPKPVDCSAFRVDKASNGYFVSNGTLLGGYVHRDFSVNHSMSGKNGVEPNYFATKGEAEKHLAEFQRRCRSEVDASQNIGQAINADPSQTVKADFTLRKANNFFLIDHDKGEVEQFFGVRLVHNEDNSDVTLEVATPHSGEDFIPLARLEFKGGRVVMYRERNAFDPYIETDEEGRIQN